MSPYENDAEKTAAARVDDLESGELHTRSTHIAFDEKGADRPRGRSDNVSRRLSFGGESLAASRLRRSASRDSIRSVRSRTQATSGIPIEFRTLSFQVAESQRNPDERSLKPTDERPSYADKHDDKSKDFEEADQHTQTVGRLCISLRTSQEQGLSAEASAQRLRENGANVLPQRRQNYLWKLFKYVFGGFCSILWIAVVIFFICWRPLGDPDPQPYNLGLAVLILIVIFLQACFSAFQDYSTAKTMKSILDMVPADATVLRDGGFTKLAASTLVPGDVVKVVIGNKVPADIRLISTSGDVRFDRSMLTGEAEEVEGAVDATDENFLESRNIALTGTMVTNGSAVGIVVFTGARSVMGHIAMATTNVKPKSTLIQREITRFVVIICCLTVVLAGAIAITWAAWLRVDHPSYMPVVAMLNNVMGTVVAFIPEGMPVAVALTLMIVARRMKTANVLPKSLATVEMLGCVNVIVSDKTGTLTENKMTVTSVGFLDESVDAEQSKEDLSEKRAKQALKALHRAGHLCNEASFDPLSISAPIMERLTQGNPTDGAVLRYAECGGAGSLVKEGYPQVHQVAFNSKNKWMLTMHDDEGGMDTNKSFLTLVKGAPDVLLPKCTTYWSHADDCVKPLDEQARGMFTALQIRLSSNAERVLLFCEKRYVPAAAPGSNDLTEEFVERGLEELTIIGVLGIFDPPRAESADTVAACRRAGIKFFMATGDFGLTGAAIARQIGIFTGERGPDTFSTLEDRRSSLSSDEREKALAKTEYSNRSLLLEGPQISRLDDADWDAVCGYEEIVFGRCTPEHKLRIINELKRRGFATAVTGDGVNDAPALKAADVGVAIVSGSDVALEAADLILLDKFSSIVDGVRLGRLVFQNLQKVIAYLLPAGSFSEIWPVVLNVWFGVPLPLSVFLMIIICVFTDLSISLSLLAEKEEFDLLSLPPRDHKRDHLINFKIYAQAYLFVGVLETLAAHAMFFFYMWKYAGIPINGLFFAFEAYGDGYYGHTADELTAFNTTGQCVYFVTLLFLQWGNVLSVRNKRLSILQADPVRPARRNPWLIVGALVALAIAVFVTEEPGLQRLFGTASVPIEFWFIPIPLGLGILLADELRKALVRAFPKGPLARIAW